MTDNPHFPSPVPALWIVSNAIGELRTAEAAVLTRARGTARVRDDKRTTLVALLHQLRAYVQVIADADLANGAAVIESAGIAVRKMPAPSPRVFSAKPGGEPEVKLVAQERHQRLEPADHDAGREVRSIMIAERVQRLADLLDAPGNNSTEYRRYLGRLARTGHPAAAGVIAIMLDMPGVVGRWAASAMIRLARSSEACREAVLATATTRLEESLDADEIRNASRVLAKLAGAQLLAMAA